MEDIQKHRHIRNVAPERSGVSDRVLSDASPAQEVHIIASCTHGKKADVLSDLRLCSIAAGSVDQRLSDWKFRLQESQADPVAAVDLYRGQHWAVVRDLPIVARAAGFRASLWVASAGYGLIPENAKVRPYSATFASSEEDSVWRPSDGDRRSALRTWWKGLQTLPSCDPAVPRSLSALSGISSEAIFLVIASPAYLSAMAEDLAGLREQLVDPQRLVVISSRNTSLPDWLIPHLVPSEAPLSGVLGGALGSLHARTARRILQESAKLPLRADILVPHYEGLVSKTEAAAIPDRLRLRDEDVRRFIREVTAGNQRLTCSAALRELRTTGKACEQHRFTALYAEVTRRADVA